MADSELPVATYDLAGNIAFLTLFAILLPPQLWLGYRHKTWGFTFGMFCGLVLEVIGYVARVQLHHAEDSFAMYVVCLTIGPAFFSASIYLCLARIIPVYGEHLARFQPRVYTTTFMLLDIVALALQSTGGAMISGTSEETDQETLDRGLAVVQAGLGIHLAAITLYVSLCIDFTVSVIKGKDSWSPRFDVLQSSRRFQGFLIALASSTFCILIRTAFRVAELSEGFYSELALNKSLFFALEGAMVLLAVTCLTAFHPGVCFGGRWEEADFSLISRREGKGKAQRMDSAGTDRDLTLDNLGSSGRAESRIA